MKERIVRVIWDDAAYNNGYYDKERERPLGKSFILVALAQLAM